MRKGPLGIGIVADQRIEPRPVLRREHGSDGALVGGIGAQAVNGFGAEGDQPAAAEQGGGTGNARGIGGQKLGGDGQAGPPVQMKGGFSQPGLP